MNYFKFSLLIITLVFINGCATLSREDCLQGSWFNLGLRDGRAGATYNRLGQHQKACLEYGVSINTKHYNEGREQGLEDYCQIDNAVEMGLNGHRYQSVCPPEIHRVFQRYNQAAYDVYQCKEDLEKLDDKLYSKENKLLSSKLSDDERSKIRTKLRNLDRKRERLRDDLRSSERILDRLLDTRRSYY
jgi:hypothetical protein